MYWERSEMNNEYKLNRDRILALDKMKTESKIALMKIGLTEDMAIEAVKAIILCKVPHIQFIY